MSRIVALLGIAFFLAPVLLAKDKSTLPAYVLNAQTVLVVIDPDAGEPLTSPGADSTARGDVERAIMKWGRFKLVMAAQTADLIVAVRKGNGRMVNPTIGGGRVDDRPVVIQPGQNGDIRLGGQQGRPPDLSQTSGQAQDSPQVRTEVGPSDDMLAVYRGGVEYPLDNPPVWRYAAKNGLMPPQIRAVDEFRKAINEAEKSASQKRQKKNP